MIHGDDDEFAFLCDGGPGHADINAMDDVVTAIRATRMAAYRYQDNGLPVEVDAPSGVLEGLAKAETHLIEAMSTLAVTIAADQYIEGPS